MMVFNSGMKMYSIAGKIEKDSIQWAHDGKTPQFITKGHYPKVAINDNRVVVEVHKSQVWNTIWYRVGTLDKDKREINWAEHDHRLRNAGCNPAVALTNDGTVIVAYQHDNKTYYCIGKVNRDTTEILWQGAGAGQPFSIPTKEPSISVNENGLVVVAAEACGIRRNSVVFCVGTKDNQNSITWSEMDQAAAENMRGCCPVVAINKQNQIISVHMSNSFRKLFMKYGVVKTDTKRIEWSVQGKPLEYDTGIYPSITLNSKNQVVRMREKNVTFGMFYEFGNLASP